MNLKGITANAKVLNLIKELNDQYYVAKNYDNGHYLIKNKTNTYYVVFKKDYFNSFKKWFKGMDEADKVDSLNVNATERAIDLDAEVILIHDEMIYHAYPAQIKNLCEKNGWKRSQNKGNNYTKNNYSGDKVEEHEWTYSFPVEPITKSIFTEFKKCRA